MKKKTKATEVLTPREVSHLAYLKFRLVPDLKESGTEATAEDFETCIQIGERLLGRPIVMDDWADEPKLETVGDDRRCELAQKHTRILIGKGLAADLPDLALPKELRWDNWLKAQGYRDSKL